MGLRVVSANERRLRVGKAVSSASGPDAFEDAVQYFVGLLSRDADQKRPIYLADPHFMTQLTDDSGTDLNLKKLCIDMFAATAGTPLLILCAKKRQKSGRASAMVVLASRADNGPCQCSVVPEPQRRETWIP